MGFSIPLCTESDSWGPPAEAVDPEKALTYAPFTRSDKFGRGESQSPDCHPSSLFVLLLYAGCPPRVGARSKANPHQESLSLLCARTQDTVCRECPSRNGGVNAPLYGFLTLASTRTVCYFLSLNLGLARRGAY